MYSRKRSFKNLHYTYIPIKTEMLKLSQHTHLRKKKKNALIVYPKITSTRPSNASGPYQKTLARENVMSNRRDPTREREALFHRSERARPAWLVKSKINRPAAPSSSISRAHGIPRTCVLAESCVYIKNGAQEEWREGRLQVYVMGCWIKGDDFNL